MRSLVMAGILLLSCADAGAQRRADEYGVLSLDAGTFFAHRPGHDISASFPYTVTSLSSGGSSQNDFDGALRGRFTSPAYLLGLKFDYGWKKHMVDVGVGLFREDGGDHGVYLKAGYGYTLQLGGLSVRPTMDLYYLMGKDKMGTIDNTDKRIEVLGYTAFEQYTVQVSDGDGGSYDHTNNANHLDVNYRRFTLLGNPKIVITPHPFGRVVIGVELGWLLQIYQRCDIQLEQTNTANSETYTVGKLKLNTNGELGGAFAAITVGVRL